MTLRTIGSLLDENLRDNPEREALVYGDTRLSYRDIGQKVDRLAEALTGLGVKPGDKVAIDLPNWPEFLFAYFAIARLGGVIVLVNTRYRLHEVRHILRDSDAVAIFVPGEFEGFDYVPMLREMRGELADLRHVIVVGDSREPDVLRFDDLLTRSRGEPFAEGRIDPENDVAVLMYTSGTTGQPKGAMHTHAGILKNEEIVTGFYEITPQDVFLLVLPMSHIITLLFVHATFVHHAKAVLMDAFKAEPVLQVVERERVTIHAAVPTAFALELGHPNFKRYDLSSLRTGLMAGASCPAELVRRVIAEMGCNVHIGYGMTETAGGITNTRFEDDIVRRTETVGRPVREVKVRIVDDQHGDMPLGQVGEIAVNIPSIMKGYYKMPEATAEVIDAEGWFYTGDLGTVDEEGFVRVVGRKKDMVIRGGYNVYPREIEDLLYTHPDVLDAAVIGVPDEILGERICACVQLRPGAQTSEGEVKELFRGKLADYKTPDYVRLVESFPFTATGKISKMQLRESVWQEMGRDA